MTRRPKRLAAPLTPSARLPALLAAAGGALVGLAVSRLLFDSLPWRFEALGHLPGALALAAVGALAAFALVTFKPAAANPAAWAPLSLLLIILFAPTVNPLRDATLLMGALALTALLLTQSRPAASRLLPLFLFLFLFSLYLACLAPAVGEADTFEFQVGIARLGIAHGSGYPLLMLVGKLFTLLPVGGTLAWRANLTSAFFGALAGVGVERLVRALRPSAVVPALLAGLAFGVAPTLWSRAVEVEAYTLNAALVAGLLLLCLRLIARPPAARRVPNVTALLFGLSLTNHLTTLLLAPVVAVSLGRWLWPALRALPTPRARLLAAATTTLRLVGLVLLGLTVYLYLPLRWPAVNHGEMLSLAQFINILTGNEARGAFQWALPFRDAGRYAIVAGKIVGEYGWAGLSLGALGLTALISAAVRQRRLLAPPLLLVLAYLPYLYFALAFNVPDPDFSAFFIPLHLILAVLLGVGLQTLLDALAAAPRRAPAWQRAAPLAAGLLLSAAALLPLASLWRNLPLVTQAGDWASQRYGELMLRQPLAPNAAILADSQKIAPLYYLQVAEGVRPDLDILVLPDEAAYRAVLDERLAAGQTVYLGRYLPGLGAGYSLRSVGPLADVAPQPFATTDLALTPTLAQPVAADITLLGFAPETGPTLAAAAPAALNFTLVWQATAPPAENLLVTLRLVDTAGNVAWQSAGSVPVSGLYPTNAWRPGEIITDFYSVPIKATFTPGDYQLQVGLFPPFATAAEGWATVTTVTVRPPAAQPVPSRQLRARLGDAWLLGYDLPASAAPGARVPVTLYWWHAAATTSVTALGETRSLAAWPLGALVPQTYVLTAPADGDSWTIPLSPSSSTMCGWLRPATAEGCALPPVRLAGEAAAEGAYNFADRLLLRAAALATPSAAPGGQVAVTLTWQGLQTMSEDYTVFVHLLGPDGLVHGQADAWPVSGTRATSGWQPGEIINDPYTILVPADAPPGEYQIEIGLYLLATNERLPVLNADSAPVADRVLVAGLTLRP